MKKLMTATVIAMMTSGSAFAASNVNVQDFYKTVTNKIPHTEQVCNIVDVPIYGETGGASTNDMIVGGIIGGLIGNQIGKGGGKNAATGVGAMTGAIIANNSKKQQTIVGYKQEQRCSNNTTYTYQTEKVYDYSIIEFLEDGKTYRVKFYK